MHKSEAQQKIKTAITDDPQKVITAAIIFDQSAQSILDDVVLEKGSPQGVAAIVLKHIFRGENNSITEAKIIKFAEFLVAA